MALNHCLVSLLLFFLYRTHKQPPNFGALIYVGSGLADKGPGQGGPERAVEGGHGLSKAVRPMMDGWTYTMITRHYLRFVGLINI